MVDTTKLVRSGTCSRSSSDEVYKENEKLFTCQYSDKLVSRETLCFAPKIELPRESDGTWKTQVIKLAEQRACEKGLDLDREICVFTFHRNWKIQYVAIRLSPLPLCVSNTLICHVRIAHTTLPPF